jgi:hypothetical protein
MLSAETHSSGVADHSPPRHMLAGKSNEHVSVAASPGRRHLAILHPREVVFGCQFKPPEDDDAPTGLEELVSLVDFEGTVGVECVTVDLPAGNCAEDDAVIDRDVVHWQNACAKVSGIGNPAH